MSKLSETILKQILAEHVNLDVSEIKFHSTLNDYAYVFAIDNELFVVCDENGAELILEEYRKATIEAAKQDIPEVYHSFFAFTQFAIYTWQSLNDIYDYVTEITFNNKTYFICSV